MSCKAGANAAHSVAAGMLCGAMSSGCYGTPVASERLEQSVVVTARDGAADFAAFGTFFVRPDVRAFGEGDFGEDMSSAGLEESAPLPDDVAAPLVQATREHLLARGYTEAAGPELVDLGIDLIYVRSLENETLCTYWGDWAYWGFPGWVYYFPYSCSTADWHSAMLVTHVTDLARARADDAAGAPAAPTPDGAAPPNADAAGVLHGVWFSGIYGVEANSVEFVTERAVAGVEQSFIQSPYFLRAPGGG
jgi:hypothetical protein